MRYRNFGATGLKISEVSFGSWGIGGTAYGAVDRQAALNALARAEELGCNLVDTAGIYGASEETLGQFLSGRRHKWIIATKFSGQDAGLERTVEAQLKRLGTEVIDFYQLHWVPKSGKELELYDGLHRLKKAGKVRFVGVSLYTAEDIDFALQEQQLDGFQIALSLLDPDPFLARRELIREKRPAVLVRSALKEGFLTGKFTATSTFPDPADQRHKWSAKQIADTVNTVERFRFLESEAGSLATAALRYPLSFPEVSTVLAGTKNATQATQNFGDTPGKTLSPQSLQRITSLQAELGLREHAGWWNKLRSLLGLS